ncbi:DUF397 domain-containing protein [Streptomyces bohaiensis]|uniref:DUF397 domain-containing protein n=1 Tax=Streptomyces bohaiensis TaxID=1431344 RepID=A0ABX1C465_9ACTN|nr:DUF397 domain-containing protein [Streptomyces bohaiensis]NJQ14025.1 DUF397 domain-containing protein [Streptomyces bohaiensis]
MGSPGVVWSLPQSAWWRSSHTASNGNCVEVARIPDSVAIRDSKRPGGGVALVPCRAWAGFVAAVARGGL